MAAFIAPEPRAHRNKTPRRWLPPPVTQGRLRVLIGSAARGGSGGKRLANGRPRHWTEGGRRARGLAPQLPPEGAVRRPPPPRLPQRSPRGFGPRAVPLPPAGLWAVPWHKRSSPLSARASAFWPGWSRVRGAAPRAWWLPSEGGRARGWESRAQPRLYKGEIGPCAGGLGVAIIS